MYIQAALNRLSRLYLYTDKHIRVVTTEKNPLIHIKIEGRVDMGGFEGELKVCNCILYFKIAKNIIWLRKTIPCDIMKKLIKTLFKT